MGKVEQPNWGIKKSYLESIVLEVVILDENCLLTPGCNSGVDNREGVLGASDGNIAHLIQANWQK